MLTFLTAWNDFFWPIIALSSQNPTVQVAFQSLATGYAPQQSIIMAGTLYGTFPVLDRLRPCSASTSSAESCKEQSRDDHTLRFPEGFAWGVATAAYQIEGAAAEDGRVPSIWDTFSHTPGKVAGGDTGDVACDHYHRMKQDLDLMADARHPRRTGSRSSWPRVLPDGPATSTRPGSTSTSELVDGLLERGITPLLTLYHWDLPQALEDAGGWLDRETADRFAELAEVIGHRSATGCSTITTLNEPWCSAFLGYALRRARARPAPTTAQRTRRGAPPQSRPRSRGHCPARRCCPPRAQLSVTLNLAHVEPASDRRAGPGRRRARRRASRTGSSSTRCCAAAIPSDCSAGHPAPHRLVLRPRR